MDRIGATERTVDEFLRGQGMQVEALDMEGATGEFLAEMERGLSGEPSSLRMIPTYVEVDGAAPSERPVVVVDAGGTNFRVATVRFGAEGVPAVERVARFEMPGVREPIGSAAFFERIARYAEKNIDDSDRVGFCFSYPSEIFPNHDGRLLRFCKEVRAKEVEGQIIGERFNAAIEAAGHDPKHIVLLNDTVATLLAGKSLSGRRYGGYVGFILGTGTNCSYIEANRKIGKVGGLDPERQQIINVESGSFAGIRRGEADLRFDARTTDPGEYTFEKMISGGYLGELSRELLVTAAQAGLFSDEFAGRLGGLAHIETREMGAFLAAPVASEESVGNSASEDDLLAAYLLLDRLVERAAKLTAVNLSSVILKSGCGSDPTHPVCITAEGSTFYGLPTLRERIDYYLRAYLGREKRRHYEFVRIENATLVGAAIAGLTN